MLETLGALRSSDMFNIVIDFPESASALQDLVLCLQHTNMAGQFAATFKAALEQRLLHAGAATSDIIHTYVSTIRAMKQVDPSGEWISWQL
jgi:anaphase-promoting complex subunit 2